VRVLVVEDESELREQLCARLRKEGWAVDSAADGKDGAFLGFEYPVDIAVVDLGLPHMSGVDVIKGWRGSGATFPVLILTARGRWQDKVEGLEAGADDYLVKPFHPEELLARLRALIRRSGGWASGEIRCGPLAIDPAAKQVSVDDQVVSLTAYEYKVLEYLLIHAGRVISKTELTEHVYEEDLDRDSNVLEVLIGRLRRKLDPRDTLKPIETLRGRGYRIAVQRGGL